MSHPYKGTLIDPRAVGPVDGSGWSAEVDIARDDGGDTVDTQYSLPGKFPTQQAALDAALTSGKRVVDKLAGPRDIQSVIADHTKLPSTYRHGLGHTRDDVAHGPGGSAVKVSGPENPEDHFRNS